MPHPSPTSLTFYPSYCFPLSPTFNAWARLTAANVHALRERAGYEGQNLYFHLNHPIKWVRLVGVVVAIDMYPARWIMLLDDSSGATIEVICKLQTQMHASAPGQAQSTTTTAKSAMESQVLFSTSDYKAPGVEGPVDGPVGLTETGRTVDLSGVDVGVVVKVKGGMGVFRGEKQVMLERISLLHGTNDEITAWAETISFHITTLKNPWNLSAEALRRARRKAEGAEAEEALKKKNLEKRRNARTLFFAIDRAVTEQEKKRKENEKKRKRRDEMKFDERKKKETIWQEKEEDEDGESRQLSEKGSSGLMHPLNLSPEAERRARRKAEGAETEETLKRKSLEKRRQARTFLFALDKALSEKERKRKENEKKKRRENKMKFDERNKKEIIRPERNEYEDEESRQLSEKGSSADKANGNVNAGMEMKIPLERHRPWIQGRYDTLGL